MKLVLKKDININNNDIVCLYACEENKDEIDRLYPQLSFLKDKADLSFFKGKVSDSLFIPLKGHPNVVIIGLGKKKDLNAEILRNSACEIIKVCKRLKCDSVKIIIPSAGSLNDEETIRYIAEGIYLSNYSFDIYKSKEDEEDKFSLKQATFFSDKKIKKDILEEIEIECGNTLLCRDLINESSEKANPVSIAGLSKSLGKNKSVGCTIYGKKELEKMKMGLLLAVSKGSKFPAQLVVLKYHGDPSSKKNIALVGKGITFDSGGMNLKSSSSIEDMRSDMAGAAACIYAIKTAAELKLRKNITAVMPLCENMIGPSAYRAGDVFTAYNGKTVEIGNTDAEGRLILADALSFTEEKFKPDYIIDIATLTGACLVALGETVAGLLSTDDKLSDAIFSAGEKTGDRVWRLPLYKDYEEMIKSDIAGIRNVSSGRNAGTITGAAFLKSFIKDTKWAHIDIAGTSWYSKARGYRPKYATGFGVRLFMELVRNL